MSFPVEYLDVSGIDEPDTRVGLDALLAMDPSVLRLAADHFSSVARNLDTACATGEPAVGELARGWSATTPRNGIDRLMCTGRLTAALLLGQSRAIDSVCLIVERAVSDARQDVLLARARLARETPAPLTHLLGALVGTGGHLADEVQKARILTDLQHALAGRTATVEAAVQGLRSALAGDPTLGPDGLRAGPTALLPPDPVMNPAHRADVHNRALLAADLHGTDPVRMEFAMSIVQSLRGAGDRAGTAQLVVYDSAAFNGQGRAGISVGDLTTATNVAVVIPGIANSPSAMAGGLQLAGDLRDEAGRQAPTATTAVVAWYGYDIPMSWSKDPSPQLGTEVRDTVAAGSAVSAMTGAPVLAADLTAIKAMSQASLRTTVLGFSMGSTTVSEAAQYPVPVDSIVLMGSPGAGWDTNAATGYRAVGADDVYVLSYDQDPVTLSITDQLASDISGFEQPFGPDPATQVFGGNHIAAATNVPLVAGTGLVANLKRVFGDPAHHSMANYMQGAALAAEGAIVVGHKSAVPTKRGR